MTDLIADAAVVLRTIARMARNGNAEYRGDIAQLAGQEAARLEAMGAGPTDGMAEAAAKALYGTEPVMERKTVGARLTPIPWESVGSIVQAICRNHALRILEAASTSAQAISVKDAAKIVRDYIIAQHGNPSWQTTANDLSEIMGEPAAFIYPPSGILSAARKLLSALYDQKDYADAFAELEVACNIAERRGQA